MNYKKLGEKFLIGAVTGAISAAAAIQPADDIEALRVLSAALLSGAIMGGINALKHRGE
jgi:hypothetical protein